LSIVALALIKVVESNVAVTDEGETENDIPAPNRKIRM
jgi:hypothetical protein